MFRRRVSTRFTCNVTLHSLEGLSNGFLTYVSWKRGRRRDRRGRSRHVLVSEGRASWEEQWTFHGTFQRDATKTLPKSLKLRVYKVKKRGKDKRIGSVEVNVSSLARFGPTGTLEEVSGQQDMPVSITEHRQRSQAAMRLTVQVLPPADGLSAHLFDDDTATSCTRNSHSDDDDDDSDDNLDDPHNGHLGGVVETPRGTSPPPVVPPPIANGRTRSGSGASNIHLPPREPDPPPPPAAPPNPNGVPPRVPSPSPTPLAHRPKERAARVSFQPDPPVTTPATNGVGTVHGSGSSPWNVSSLPRGSPVNPPPNDAVVTSLRRELQQRDDEIRELRQTVKRLRREGEQRILIESAVITCRHTYVEGRPLTSVILYRSLRHWGHLGGGTPPADGTTRRFTNAVRVMAARSSEIGDTAAQCYWLSTMTTLLATIQFQYPSTVPAEVDPAASDVAQLMATLREGAVSSPPTSDGEAAVPSSVLDLVVDLNTVAAEIYTTVVRSAMDRLPSTLLMAAMLDEGEGGEGGPPTPEGRASSRRASGSVGSELSTVIAVLDHFHGHLRTASLPAELQTQFFCQVYFYVNTVVLDGLLGEQQLCCVGTMLALKMHVARLDEWVTTHREHLTSHPQRFLRHLRQTANVLLLNNKDSVLDPGLRAAVCPDLSGAVVAQLLQNYSVDQYDAVGFPYSSVRAIKYNSGTREDAAPRPMGMDITAPVLWTADLVGSAVHSVPLPTTLVPKELLEHTAFAFLFGDD